jgi:L-lactate dehydrogenase complex protein LldG
VSARENILRRVREARRVPPGRPAPGEIRRVEDRILARPVGPRPAVSGDPVALFLHQCERMSSTVARVADVGAVPAAVAAFLSGRGLPLKAAAWPSIAALDWSGAGMAVEARPARGDDLVGITGVHLAIAETGTLMLLSGPDTYPVTSLLPETHVAVVPAGRIEPAMEEAWARTRRETGELPRAVNFVSGPSRTADIEGQLQIGAHGPFRVHVVVVG